MLGWIIEVQRAVADYTIGTVIVMVHMATADRRARRVALPAPAK